MRQPDTMSPGTMKTGATQAQVRRSSSLPYPTKTRSSCPPYPTTTMPPPSRRLSVQSSYRPKSIEAVTGVKAVGSTTLAARMAKHMPPRAKKETHTTTGIGAVKIMVSIPTWSIPSLLLSMSLRL